MHLPTIVVGLAVVLCLLAVWVWDRRRVPRARTPWGTWPADARDLALIGRYARDRAKDDPGRLLDDRTWTDLNMDDVFRLVDRAESLVGQQVLYSRLRSAPTADALEDFEALVEALAGQPALRLQVETALRRMRRVDGSDLNWLIQPGTFDVRPWHVVFPVLTVLVV